MTPSLPSNLHDEYKHHQANKDQGPAKSPTQDIDLSLMDFEELCREVEIIINAKVFTSIATNAVKLIISI